MNLSLHQVMAPVTTLGPGRRMAVWVQGCTLGCPGCASQDTWDPAAGQDVDVALFAAELAQQIAARELTGLTLTGGEPIQQADAVAELIEQVRARLPDRELDTLLFTGYTAPAAARHERLWRSVDIAVCGPYRPERRSARYLVASDNQELLTLTPLGARRLAGARPEGGLVAVVDDYDIALAGIPAAGDLPSIEAKLAERGIQLGGVSWRS